MQTIENDISSNDFWSSHKRSLFTIVLFIVIFFVARAFIQPINDHDYTTAVDSVQSFLNGKSPYAPGHFNMPPWSIFFLVPLAYQPIQSWLALNIALFVAINFDLGKPSALLLLVHPIFITLFAAANPEWLVVGSGLWLLYRTEKGVGRGMAWLLLACKPQTTFILLVIDGWKAYRERDWIAFALAAVGAIGSTILFPQFFERISDTSQFVWSVSALPNIGVIGCAAVTAFILLVRRNRLDDGRTLGLLLAPIWSPYMLEYSCTALLFTMRGAGWLRTSLYLVLSIGLAALFWRDFHVAEATGILGMTLLAAILAPGLPKKDLAAEESDVWAFSQRTDSDLLRAKAAQVNQGKGEMVSSQEAKVSGDKTDE